MRMTTSAVYVNAYTNTGLCFEGRREGPVCVVPMLTPQANIINISGTPWGGNPRVSASKNI